MGGAPAVIYVSVTNRGSAPYNGDGNDQIRVLWAKASSGLSWPAPWAGPKMGAAAAAPHSWSRFRNPHLELHPHDILPFALSYRLLPGYRSGHPLRFGRG